MGTLGKLFAVTVIAPGFIVYKVLEAAVQGIALGLRGSKKQGAYGDKEFATDRVLRKAGYFEPRGFMPAVTKSGRRIYLHGESCMVMWGKRGAGKTLVASSSIRAASRRKTKPSFIVCDAHGHVEGNVSEHLQTENYRILRLDLTDPLRSDKIDPFSHIKRGLAFDYEEAVQRVAMGMMPKSGKENDVGEHFIDAGRAVLEAAIACRDLYSDDMSIGDVAEFLLTDKKARTQVFEKMRKDPSLLVQAGVDQFEAAGDRERGSIDTTLARKLRPWISKSIRHVTTISSADEYWTFEELLTGDKPFALFITTGGDEEGYGGTFARLVLTVAIYEMKRLWGQTKMRLPRPVDMLIDEPGTIGNCTAFKVVVKELRKVGVNLALFPQDFDEIKNTYSDSSVILSNSDWVIAGGSNDAKLYREASQLAGERTARSRSFSRGEESEHEIGQSLISVSDFQSLAPDELVLIAQGIVAKPKKPFVVKDGRPVRFL